MIRIHKEGAGIITLSAVLATIIAIFATALLPWTVFLPILVAIATMLVMIIRFFRTPKRPFSERKDAVLAPADGTVVAIEKVKENEYFEDERMLVSIFMSIHDVHVNWFPVPGKVRYCKYHPGKYLVARHPKSSILNERTTVVIDDHGREVLVRQIAGFVARRIISYASEGKNVKQAEEMGFIRFGSRLDVYLPTDAHIAVNMKDKTIGGITPIAHF